MAQSRASEQVSLPGSVTPSTRKPSLPLVSCDHGFSLKLMKLMIPHGAPRDFFAHFQGVWGPKRKGGKLFLRNHFSNFKGLRQVTCRLNANPRPRDGAAPSTKPSCHGTPGRAAVMWRTLQQTSASSPGQQRSTCGQQPVPVRAYTSSPLPHQSLASPQVFKQETKLAATCRCRNQQKII